MKTKNLFLKKEIIEILDSGSMMRLQGGAISAATNPQCNPNYTIGSCICGTWDEEEEEEDWDKPQTDGGECCEDTVDCDQSMMLGNCGGVPGEPSVSHAD